MVIGNKIINELKIVETINKSVGWKYEPRGMSPGALAKAFILSTFTDIRIPLTHLEERLSGYDLYYLLGLESEHAINAFNAGRMLKTLGDNNPDGIYEKLALTALQQYEIPVGRTHGDTTTISFHGNYDINELELTEEEKEEVLRIEKGYNKDGRAGDAQVVVGQIVTEQGIPITNKILSGATSDVEWNKIALNYFDEVREKGFNQGVFVADSKLVTEELIKRMSNPENYVPFVSRCPANFNERLESQVIKKAYTAKEWRNIGQISEGKKASTYQMQSFVENVFNIQMRLIVLESSSLKESAERTLEKAKEQLLPLIKKIEKREFACGEDAEKEISIFMKAKEMKLFNCTHEIKKIIKEKWPRGRRGAKTTAVITETYEIRIHELDFDNENRESYLQNNSSFVLISNITDENVTDEEIVKTYKGQHVVENSFRQLKQPCLASVIYLKNPERIKGLTMLLCLSLLIRAIIQYRMRDGLKKFNEANPDEIIYAGWAGRPLFSPTFKLLYEHAFGCFYERVSSVEYRFVWSSHKIQDRVEALLNLMGISISTLLG